MRDNCWKEQGLVRPSPSPNSDAANRNPVLRMAMEAQGGMVSKYLMVRSDTVLAAGS